MQSQEYNATRAEIITDKSGAVWNTFAELEGLLNKSAVAMQYFEKSSGWFSQRVHGCTVRNKAMAFKENEYHQLADALRDIAKRLIAHADEIDNAKIEE